VDGSGVVQLLRRDGLGTVEAVSGVDSDSGTVALLVTF
jgi:hypothetical protein